MPICPKHPFFQTAHLPKLPICPNCPFAMVLVSPGAHFPLKPTSPNVHRSQNAYLLLSAHLPQLLICPGAHFAGEHLPQMPISPLMLTCPNAHRSQGAHYTPKCSFAAISLPACPGVHFPGAHFSQVPIAPKAHLPLCPSASIVLVCPIKCPKYPFAPVTSCPYNCAHFSWCPFFSSAHLPQIAK